MTDRPAPVAAAARPEPGAPFAFGGGGNCGGDKIAVASAPPKI